MPSGPSWAPLQTGCRQRGKCPAGRTGPWPRPARGAWRGRCQPQAPCLAGRPGCQAPGSRVPRSTRDRGHAAGIPSCRGAPHTHQCCVELPSPGPQLPVTEAIENGNYEEQSPQRPARGNVGHVEPNPAGHRGACLERTPGPCHAKARSQASTSSSNPLSRLGRHAPRGMCLGPRISRVVFMGSFCVGHLLGRATVITCPWGPNARRPAAASPPPFCTSSHCSLPCSGVVSRICDAWAHGMDMSPSSALPATSLWACSRPQLPATHMPSMDTNQALEVARSSLLP